MKTKTICGRKIGFLTNAQEIEESTFKESEVINNIQPEEQEQSELNNITFQITPIHAEVKQRLAMCEKIITQKEFLNYTNEQKMEIIEEIKHQAAVDAQLMLTYLR